MSIIIIIMIIIVITIIIMIILITIHHPSNPSIPYVNDRTTPALSHHGSSWWGRSTTWSSAPCRGCRGHGDLEGKSNDVNGSMFEYGIYIYNIIITINNNNNNNIYIYSIHNIYIYIYIYIVIILTIYIYNIFNMYVYIYIHIYLWHKQTHLLVKLGNDPNMVQVQFSWTFLDQGATRWISHAQPVAWPQKGYVWWFSGSLTLKHDDIIYIYIHIYKLNV